MGKKKKTGCEHPQTKKIGMDGTQWCTSCGAYTTPAFGTPMEKYDWSLPSDVAESREELILRDSAEGFVLLRKVAEARGVRHCITQIRKGLY